MPKKKTQTTQKAQRAQPTRTAKKIAFAIAAHPDDIEFLMAGTLILLRRAGYEIHYMTVANGMCGSVDWAAAKTVRIRHEEARRAAASIGATFHESLVDDIAILYERKTLARLAAVIREVAPEILLTHSPVDYMEDHTNTARLAVTAAFTRGMRNFITAPPRPPVMSEVTVYHAQPHGNRGPLGEVIEPGLFVDIGQVIDAKIAALSEHKSQKDWLDRSQGVGSYLEMMRAMALEVGRMSGRFEYAEGWRRHNPLGFCAPGADPLSAALGPHATAPPAIPF